MEQFSEALTQRDYYGARHIIQSFENDLSPELRQQGLEIIAKWMALTDLMPLEFAMADMHQLRRSGKTAEASWAANDLVRTVEESSFQYLDGQQLKKVLISTKINGS